MDKIKINLGCGKDIRTGYVNVDDGSMWPDKLPDNVVVHNLNHFPWPFADDSANEILMWHVLEHLPDTALVMREVKRILISGGKFWGQVPYGLSAAGLTHWQHRKYFIAATFEGIANDFGMKLIYSKNINGCTNWKQFLRNMVPFKDFIARAGWSEAFDYVDFQLIKP